MESPIRSVFHHNLVRLITARGTTNKEIADFMGVSPTTVGNWKSGKKIPRMDKIDKLCTFFGVERTDFTTLREEGRASINLKGIAMHKKIPILGTIAAGKPIEAQEDVTGFVIPDVKTRADFALRVKGESMINIPIYDNDIVFIRSQPEVEEGEIAAVLIDGEATLKKFYRHDGAVELRPANDSMRSMYFTEGNCEDFRILGKCVGVMHGFE